MSVNVCTGLCELLAPYYALCLVGRTLRKAVTCVVGRLHTRRTAAKVWARMLVQSGVVHCRYYLPGQMAFF